MRKNKFYCVLIAVLEPVITNKLLRGGLSKLNQRVTLFAISDENISKTDNVEQNIRECIKIDTFLFRNKQIIKIKLFL